MIESCLPHTPSRPRKADRCAEHAGRRVRARLLGCLLACCAAVGSPWAVAHGLSVFAYADGPSVRGSVRFAGGEAAPGARVTVLAPDGRVLAELEAAADGTFAYKPPEAVDQVVRARTAEGHAAEWVVRAEELHRPATLPERRPLAAGSSGDEPSLGPEGRRSTAELEELVERAVARQVRPLREQIMAYEERVRLRDLVGGIGYILGLAGLGLWWRCRGSRGG